MADKKSDVIDLRVIFKEIKKHKRHTNLIGIIRF